MNENPYESPVGDDTRLSRVRPRRLLVWFSYAIAALLLAFYVIVLFATRNDYSNLRQAESRQIIQFLVLLGVYSIICGCLPIVQFISVYRGSLTASKCAYWISTIAMGLAMVLVPIYPLIECRDPKLQGTEVIGAIGFATISAVFFINRRLHHTWIATLQRFLQSAG